MAYQNPDYYLFINLTKFCNIDCQRCYLSLDNRSKKDFLPLETLELFLLNPKFKDAKINIALEGGEPSICGEKLLEQYIIKINEILPKANQQFVTNLFKTPDFLFKLIKKYHNSNLETTLALRKKYTKYNPSNINYDKNNSDLKFLKEFEKKILYLNENGFNCAVNLELNIETINLGPSALIEFLKKTKTKFLNIDFSLDFESFFKNPKYDIYGYPIVLGTATNLEISNYLKKLYLNYNSFLLENSINIDILYNIHNSLTNNMFNVNNDSGNFFTLNPNGDVTTNPLFSDLPETFLGNIVNGWGNIINHKILTKYKNRFNERKNLQNCNSCDYYKYCSGGPSHASIDDISKECSGNKLVYKFISSLTDV